MGATGARVRRARSVGKGLAAGHDFYISRAVSQKGSCVSQQGPTESAVLLSGSDYGCCDCGDVGSPENWEVAGNAHASEAYAWRQSGFCRHHPGPREDSEPSRAQSAGLNLHLS